MGLCGALSRVKPRPKTLGACFTRRPRFLPDLWIEAVTAIVVVKGGAVLDEDTVIKHCAGAMAHFKVPKRVVFIDSLPKNPSGKLLKRELRQRYLGSQTLDGATQKNFG